MLTEAEQKWLDATPFGECRTVTKCGGGYTTDRRLAPWSPPLTLAPYDQVPYSPIWTGTPVIDMSTTTC